MVRPESARSVLLCSVGLGLDGGIACVGRCMARALDDEVVAGNLERVDRVLYRDDPAGQPAPPPSGEQHLALASKRRFAWQIWRSFRKRRHDLVLFDHVGLSAVCMLPLPSFPPPRYAVFTHWWELQTQRTRKYDRALRGAHLLLANSRFSAGELCERLPDRRERVRSVPLCVDPARVEAWKVQEETAPPGARELAILIVARMDGEGTKGHDTLLEAWPLVTQRIPVARLWMVGGGNDLPRLEAKARAAGLADTVLFPGRVCDVELGGLYRRATVFAMPSRSEGFGIVYAEAMWHGLPCIGASGCAAGEVILEGKTGLLVPFGDVERTAAAMLDLLGDRERARSMGEEGRRRARSYFSFDRFRDDLLSALELA